MVQRAALAIMAPLMFAVLSARAGELPDPRLALGVIQQMRLALLCSDDAPSEDSEDYSYTSEDSPPKGRAGEPSQRGPPAQVPAGDLVEV